MFDDANRFSKLKISCLYKDYNNDGCVNYTYIIKVSFPYIIKVSIITDSINYMHCEKQ